MKVARFSQGDEVRFGVLDGPELVVLKGHPIVNGYEPSGERVPLKEVKLLAPSIPSKIVCVGKNYPAHIDEMGMAADAEPALFLKPSSAIVGPGDNIFLPQQSGQVELEVELALVIGALTRNVSPEDALQYVWGFTVANDVTARDLQASDAQWMRSKSFDSFCPIGPWLETEFIPEDQMIESRINGEVVQSSTIDQMIFTVPQIISYVSHNMTLLPGDVIITGTPAGITKINSGDIVECEVEGVGTLINHVV